MDILLWVGEVRPQLSEFSTLLPCGLQELISDHQARQQAPLPGEPSHRLCLGSFLQASPKVDEVMGWAWIQWLRSLLKGRPSQNHTG